MKYREIKVSGQWTHKTLNDVKAKARMDDYLSRLPDGVEIEREAKRIFPEHTDQQVKCHFGLVIETILEIFDDRGWDLQVLCPDVPPGIRVTQTVLHEYLYALAGDVGPNGERKRISSPMSTLEMVQFFNNIRERVAAKWNIQIQDPNPLWNYKEPT